MRARLYVQFGDDEQLIGVYGNEAELVDAEARVKAAFLLDRSAIVTGYRVALERDPPGWAKH